MIWIFSSQIHFRQTRIWPLIRTVYDLRYGFYNNTQTRHTASIFIDTGFEHMLKNAGIITIVFTGIATELEWSLGLGMPSQRICVFTIYRWTWEITWKHEEFNNHYKFKRDWKCLVKSLEEEHLISKASGLISAKWYINVEGTLFWILFDFVSKLHALYWRTIDDDYKTRR